MKVKNIFSSRKNKKKKNNQQVTSSSTVTSHEKLIISQSSVSQSIEEEKENGKKTLTVTTSTEETKVVLRNKKKKSSLKHSEQSDSSKPRSSTDSTKERSSRRPWSFMEQLRRQESKESNNSSARSSLNVEDLISASGTRQHENEELPGSSLDAVTKAGTPGRKSGASTLPRSLDPSEITDSSLPPSGSHHKTSTIGHRDSQAAVEAVHEHSKRPKTIDFRFFHFFKRSGSGDAILPSPESNSSGTSSSNRSSFRGKNKNKKRDSKKKRDAEIAKAHHGSYPSSKNSSIKSQEDSRLRSLSDGCKTSHLINPEHILVNCDEQAITDYVELAAVTAVKEKRVPDNGEPAFYIEDDDSDTQVDSRPPSSTNTVINHECGTVSSLEIEAGCRDSTCSNTSHSKVGGSSSQLDLARSNSSSTESSSRRSSFVCEPRESPLPEDSVATYENSMGPGARSKDLSSRASTSRLQGSRQQVQRAFSNETAQDPPNYIAQARCSQSVSNLASDSTLSDGASSSKLQLPRSSSDADKSASGNSDFIQPSLKNQKQEVLGLHAESASAISDMTPPSPILRAIGYPSVVMRRHKHRRNKQRPNSAYADERTQQVLSLNMEDLPTYSRMRHEMMRDKAAGTYPSYEDILAVREVKNQQTRGTASSLASGLQYASTASTRIRRRGGALAQRSSNGFPNAASVDDLDSLSSSYGSKQSLNDQRLDDDELLNAILARANANSQNSGVVLRHQEPSSKRVKTIRKSVVSLANLISPGKPNRSSNKIQRSSSFKESGSSTTNTASVAPFKPYRPPSNTPNKKVNRRSKLWCETFDHAGLNERQLRWQEAIFELYQGERDLVQDLTMAKQTYRDSMVTLKMLSDEEVTLIFGKLGCLLPLHEELLNKLEQARGEDGRTLAIGYIFVEWFPRISTAYREYCANQSDAKYALDAAVERDARVRDFLQRCLESPFSRKLDLWSYLDLPRTRLVKYPLLLNNVLKRTPVELDEERNNLEKVMDIIGEIIEQVDKTTGEQQCRYIRSKLEYLDDKQKSPFVDNSRLLLCSGQLKNNRGTKMHVFLFEQAIMLTRQATRSNKLSYQVYRNPLPLRSLTVDASEGDKLSGSFRGGILSSEKTLKHSFRIKSEELNVSYTLQACEEHDRKQWVNAIQDALTKYKETHSDLYPPETQLLSARRRATYDIAQNHSSKKKAARAAQRSSSDKSNQSVASSTDKSVQEESHEEDESTEDVTIWRGRSRTVDHSLMSSKSSLSRKSSTSSKEEEKKDKKSSKKNKNKTETPVPKQIDRLQADNEDGPPSPLRQGFRKNVVSRHFSLSGADRRKPVIPRNTEGEERPRNPCRRSRSLTASPQTIRTAVARFGNRKSHSKNGGLAPSSAAKPPIGPNSSPYNLRRSPSLQINSRPIQESQSTPNLLAVRRNSGSSNSSGRQNSLCENNSNGVQLLRKCSYGGSARELRSVAQRAKEAKAQRNARSLNGSRNASEGETEVTTSSEEPEAVERSEIDQEGNGPTSNTDNSDVTNEVIPSDTDTTPEEGVEPPKLDEKPISENCDAAPPPSISPATEESGDNGTTSALTDITTPEDIEIGFPNDDAGVPSSDVASVDDVTPVDDVTMAEEENLSSAPGQEDTSDDNVVQTHDVSNSDVKSNEGEQPGDVIAEYSKGPTDHLPAQNSSGDLISFDDESVDILSEAIQSLVDEMIVQIISQLSTNDEASSAADESQESPPDPEVVVMDESDNEDVVSEDVSSNNPVLQNEESDPIISDEAPMEQENPEATSDQDAVDSGMEVIQSESSSDIDNNNSLPENQKKQTSGCLKHENDTSLVTCRTEMGDSMDTSGVHTTSIIGQHHILNSNLQASV